MINMVDFFKDLLESFVHGRSVICNYGKPISVKDMLQDNLGVDQTTKKLRRVLKVHFRSLRISTLGPYIYDHAQVVSSLLHSKKVKEAVEEEVGRRKVSTQRVQKKSSKIILKKLFQKRLFHM